MMVLVTDSTCGDGEELVRASLVELLIISEHLSKFLAGFHYLSLSCYANCHLQKYKIYAP